MPGGDDSFLESETTHNEEQQQKQQEDEEEEEKRKEEEPVTVQEPPSELAVDRIVDIIDFEVEHILWERMSRKDHFDSLEWFWNHFPGRDVQCGRRFIRRLMVHILTNTCGSHPYGLKANNGKDIEEEVEPLVRWNEEQWSGLRDSFEFLRTLMLRRDAELNYLDPNDVVADGETVDNERAESPLFKKKLRVFMDNIQIHRILAPIRKGLESQTRRVGKESIGKKKLEAVWKMIYNLDEGSRVKEALLEFFEMEKLEEPADETNIPPLKLLGDLAKLLQAPPFDLCYFQNTIEHIVHRFNQIVSGNHDCALIQARYAIPPDSKLHQTLSPTVDVRVAEFSARRRKNAAKMDKEKLDELRRGRTALNSGHGDDPLDAAVQATEGAKRTSNDEDQEDPSEETKKRKRIPRLTIVEDMEDDDEGEMSAAKLSKVPKRKRNTSEAATGRAAHMIPPDEGIFDEDGKVLKRLRWTDEEKLCVKEGVKLHGVGKWKEIKSDYAAILRNRTPVQIKDCWRTMTKNQEV